MARLRGWALGAPHVLVVEALDGTARRLDAERVLRMRRWPLCETPADADILIVCGEVTEALGPAVTRLRQAMTEPAASAVVGRAGGVTFDVAEPQADRALDAAAALLRERAACAPQRPLQREEAEDGADGEHGGDRHEHGHDDSHDDSHERHHHGKPGGLAMASRSEDRDGLKLDVLEIPFRFGPSGWPALIRVTLHLQGDVVQKARAEPACRHAGGSRSGGSWWDGPWRAALAGTPATTRDAERMRAAAHLDSLSRLLDVAGHADAATGARRLRDCCLARGDPGSLRDDLGPLARAIRRGGVLERASAGTGVLTADRAVALGIGGPALRACGRPRDLRTRMPAYDGFEPVVATGEGDARARILQWLAETEQALAIAAAAPRPLAPVEERLEGPRGLIGRGATPPSAGLLAAIPELVVGDVLAGARLTIASLDPDGNDAGDRSWEAPRTQEAGDGR